MRLPSLLARALPVLLVATLAIPLRSQTQPVPPPYAKLRQERSARLTAPYGWFSLIALGWIRPGLTTVGSAPGNNVLLPRDAAPAQLMQLELTNDNAILLARDPALRLHNAPAPLGAPLPQDEEDTSALTVGRLRMWVIDRGGKKYLRIKDPESPTRQHAHPLTWYSPDPQYRVLARWVPFATPHTLRVLNELDQISTEPVPGYAEFTLGGRTLRLQPMIEDGNLFFVFRDTTADTKETYGAGRFLTVAPPPGGMHSAGTLVLDFNQAVNPPCAYSPYATCPVASPENRLPVRIPAGEKRYN
jgi:uncharacterized protein